MGRRKLTVEGTYSWANIWYPGYLEVTSAIAGVGWQLDRQNSDPWSSQFFPDGRAVDSRCRELYTARGYLYRRWRAPDELFGGQNRLPAEVRDRMASYVKVGIKYDSDTRRQETSVYDYTFGRQ